jgi:GT2 family glycosyltransferase
MQGNEPSHGLETPTMSSCSYLLRARNSGFRIYDSLAHCIDHYNGANTLHTFRIVADEPLLSQLRPFRYLHDRVIIFRAGD